jgi:hypothetical protein
MDTTRKVISDVTGSMKATTEDSRISYRLVLSILTAKTMKFIKQDADARRLFQVSEGWKRIPCLHLEEVDMQECGFDIPQCTFMMKSVEEVPEVFQSTYGNIIKVFTIDGVKEFKQTTLAGYKDIRRREYFDKKIKYFILMEKHIWIPDSEIEEIMVVGLFKHPFEVTKLIDPDSKCLKPLDEPFPCPDYLLDPVKTDTKMELANIYERMIKDEKSNLNTNEKT